MDEIVALLEERFGVGPDYAAIVTVLSDDHASGELPDRFQRFYADRLIERSRARYRAKKVT